MNIVELITKKRDKLALSKDEIDFFVSGIVNESIADYQTSAMLMAMFINGLNEEETANLTTSMATTGTVLDLTQIKGIKLDKHSTGGVADTTTLILAPLVASLNLPIVKMSGRGLGFTGGTLDKLESIPNFNINLSKDDVIKNIKEIGIVLMSQTSDITPADKKMYALRDVTGTIDNYSLIAASIMSKKIAAGADAIVLDVKCGSGAFMKDFESAKKLAQEMVKIGNNVGRKVKAVISSMDQPLGNNVGNAFEVIEAIETLKGNVTGDLLEVALVLGTEMVVLSGKTQEEARKLLLENIKNGKGLEKLRQLIKLQGGNTAVIDDYSLFPRASEKYVCLAKKDGYIYEMNCSQIGNAAIAVGAGRLKKEDSIDYGSGIIMNVRLGQHVTKGEPIAEIYAEKQEHCLAASKFLEEAIIINDSAPQIKPVILEII